MTQSFNLSQLANNVNSAGKLNAAQGLDSTVPVPNGGTGQSSFADGELLIGNSTGNTLTKAKLTAGTNVTITEGPGSITIAAAGGGGGGGTGDPVSGELGYALYTTGSGTWTCPPGVTKVKVTVIGGGGGGYYNGSDPMVGEGGAGGIATGIYTVVPGTGYAYTVGAAGNGSADPGIGGSSSSGGNSSFASFCSATGGSGSSFSLLNSGGSSTNGTGSGGTFINSSVGSSFAGDISIFRGSVHRVTGNTNTIQPTDPGVVWTATLPYVPGARGGAGFGGVSGAVYIEYVEVTGSATANGANLGYALYTSGSGTWTCPPGVTKVKATVIGGGGGAGLAWGGVAIGMYTVTPGTGYAYTVGAGGSGQQAGGSSSLAGLCSATGGSISGFFQGSAGVGTGGTFANTSVGQMTTYPSSQGDTGQNSNLPTLYSTGIPPFSGAIVNESYSTPLTWTPTSYYAPGAFGASWAAASLGWMGGGGVGGAIYIEYIDGVGLGATVADEGIQITGAVSSFNFTGSGVTATSVGNAVTVNVPGGSSVPAASDAVGSIMLVTRADGQVFNYNSTISGSELRRIGQFVLYTSGYNLTPSVFTVINTAYELGAGNSMGATWPLAPFSLMQSGQSLTGTWRALGSHSSTSVAIDNSGNYSYMAYQSIHLAMRIA